MPRRPDRLIVSRAATFDVSGVENVVLTLDDEGIRTACDVYVNCAGNVKYQGGIVRLYAIVDSTRARVASYTITAGDVATVGGVRAINWTGSAADKFDVTFQGITDLPGTIPLTVAACAYGIAECDEQENYSNAI